MTEPGAMLYMCRACKRLGRCRLGFTEQRMTEAGVMETKLSASRDYEAGVNIAHGGWTAAAMDDLLGHLLASEGRLAVTASLTVKYLRPVPLERELTAKAWCDSVDGNRRVQKGELRLAATGAVLAVAEGVFVERDSSHYTRHRDWLAAEDAKSDGGE